jgi:hypothetical protein
VETTHPEQKDPLLPSSKTGADDDWRNAYTESVKEAATAKGYDLRFAEGTVYTREPT